MAKIPLRAYIKDIENLIERGEIDQAIAHARNILQSYPKHIDTYRLFGKAFLESQRYSEAADILQRVLSVIPDDFVSQVGMSIIREDEGNLDAAIWHMERAYEVQPFNPAVQEELRRLYGRRDGIEPPKIRLTRGALIRMYMRGELYPQAIAETRTALAEDSQRFDLLVLLARLYNQTNQKIEATEICSTIISKLAYCYEANLILAEILPGTSRAEDARKFQQRIYALDPYAAFISPAAPTSDLVPDQAVMVEQFNWEESLKEPQKPDWVRTIGAAWEESEEEELPDWISTLKPDEAQDITERVIAADTSPEEGSPEAEPQEMEETPTGDEEVIPDWMKLAGWTAAARRADEIMAEQPETGEGEITPAEIPDWLQAVAPVEALEDTGEEAAVSEWFDTLEGSTEAPAVETPSSPPDEGLVFDDLPEWARTSESPGSESFINLEDTTPSWLAASSPDEMNIDEQTSELPAWLSSAEVEPGLEEETPAGEELPEWLTKAEEQTSAASEVAGLTAAAATAAWLGNLSESPETEEGQTNAPEQATETSPAPLNVSDEDAGMAWLEALAVRQGADEDTLITPPEQRLETTPDWLQREIEADKLASIEGVGEVEEGQEAAQAYLEEMPKEEALPGWSEVDTLPVKSEQESGLAEEVSGVVAELTPQASESSFTESAPDITDIDATMAWLEALAARQGADEATLTTRPEDRTEIPPEWLQKEMETGQPATLPAVGMEELAIEPQAAEESQVSDIEPVAEETFQSSIAWLGAITAKLSAQEETPATETAAEAEEQFSLSPEGVQPEPTSDDILPTKAELLEAEIPKFGELAGEASVSEAPVGEMPIEETLGPEESFIFEESMPEIQEAVASLADEESLVEETTPEWLKGIGEEQSEIEQPWSWTTEEGTAESEALETPLTAREQPLPDWLQQSEIVEEVPEVIEDSTEMPDWLREIATEEEKVLLPGSEFQSAWEPEIDLEEQPTRPEPVEQGASAISATLAEAQAALSRGDLNNALARYCGFIEKGEFLGEVIHDLRDALYRYPVDITIWQALGDAYAQNNQLQEALDAYTKAEELLR